MGICEATLSACGVLAGVCVYLFKALQVSREQHIADLREAAKQHSVLREEALTGKESPQ